jgi:hypothetical protein
MKHLLSSFTLLLLSTLAFGSDNRSAPNVFSSGSTISSSQMNENFNFLASEIRDKDVNCNNGETITDAINEGYNSLTIYGSCNSAIAVYRLDPSPFGWSYSDLPNKPLSSLIIKGGNNDGSDSITAPSIGNFKFFVKDNAFVQLNKITLTTEISVYEGAMLRMDDSTLNGYVEVNNNATFISHDSNITSMNDDPAIRVKANSHAHIENSDITGSSSGYEAIWLWNNGSIMLQGTSSVTAPSGTSAISLTTASSAVINDDVQINSVDQTAIYMDKNSVVELNDNVAITRSDGNDEIFVDPTSALRINGSDITLANVGCEGITSYVQDGSNNSVNISNICNGYQNLTPNFVKITSGNCESNGYNNLTSPHECSQAIGSIVRAIHDGADTYGCAEGTDNTFNSQQTSWRVEDKSWVNAMWCKE